MSKLIMIVDDDRMTVELVKRRLEENGYATLTASDGQEALNLLATKTPDLIILDVEMPNMNGYTFIVEKNKIPACTKVPVIVSTSHQETQPLFARHGVHSYLIKPLNMQDLLKRITEICGS